MTHREQQSRTRTIVATIVLAATACLGTATAFASGASERHFTGRSSQAGQKYPGYPGQSCARYWTSPNPCAVRFKVRGSEIRKFELSIVYATRDNGVHTYVRAAVEIPKAKLVDGRFRAVEHYPHRLPRYHHNRDRIVVSGTVSGSTASGRVSGYHSTRVWGHSIRWSVPGGRITWRATLSAPSDQSGRDSLVPGIGVIQGFVSGGSAHR